MESLLTRFLERPLKVGTILQNKYEIIEIIGRGSYGLVYLALELKHRKKVIIKQHRERKGKRSKESLINEAQILSSLNHPSIPQCIELFQEGKKYFLVMDLVEGTNFEDLVLNEGKTYDEKESVQILLKVVNIVQYLHERRLIHRDLRLPNIIYYRNQIFIIDFGLAVFYEEKECDSSKNPSSEKELFREKQYRSDFYALGHFLLFLLYSNFEPTSKNEQSWEEELPISPDTKKTIRKLLRIDKQYECISEISRDLRNAIDKL